METKFSITETGSKFQVPRVSATTKPTIDDPVVTERMEIFLVGEKVEARAAPAQVPVRTPLEGRFRGLVQVWRKSVRPTTTLAQLLDHPAYNQIIGMGLVAREPVVRLILLDLEKHPRQWFQALAEIAGEDPVPADATKFEEFRSAWLNWGRDRMLI